MTQKHTLFTEKKAKAHIINAMLKLRDTIPDSEQPVIALFERYMLDIGLNEFHSKVGFFHYCLARLSTLKFVFLLIVSIASLLTLMRVDITISALMAPELPALLFYFSATWVLGYPFLARHLIKRQARYNWNESIYDVMFQPLAQNLVDNYDYLNSQNLRSVVQLSQETLARLKYLEYYLSDLDSQITYIIQPWFQADRLRSDRVRFQDECQRLGITPSPRSE